MAERDGPKQLEVEQLENDSLLEDDDMSQQAMPQRTLRRWRFVEWLIWGVLILSLLALMTDNIRLRRKQDAVAESAFKTDLSKFTLKRAIFSRSILISGNDIAAAKPLAGLIEYIFTGGIQVDESGKLYREVDPSKPQYAGAPSPEIDKSWDDLLGGE